MHLQTYRQDYGIFTNGKRVLCPYIALLCIILISAGWKMALLAMHHGPEWLRIDSSISQAQCVLDAS